MFCKKPRLSAEGIPPLIKGHIISTKSASQHLHSTFKSGDTAMHDNSSYIINPESDIFKSL